MYFLPHSRLCTCEPFSTWFNIAECTRGYLMSLIFHQDKEPYKVWAKAKDQRVSSHFKVFTHEQLGHAFSSKSTAVAVHKHCLHAFNFVVKARYDDLVSACDGLHPHTRIAVCLEMPLCARRWPLRATPWAHTRMSLEPRTPSVIWKRILCLIPTRRSRCTS